MSGTKVRCAVRYPRLRLILLLVVPTYGSPSVLMVESHDIVPSTTACLFDAGASSNTPASLQTKIDEITAAASLRRSDTLASISTTSTTSTTELPNSPTAGVQLSQIQTEELSPPYSPPALASPIGSSPSTSPTQTRSSSLQRSTSRKRTRRRSSVNTVLKQWFGRIVHINPSDDHSEHESGDARKVAREMTMHAKNRVSHSNSDSSGDEAPSSDTMALGADAAWKLFEPGNCSTVCIVAHD
jgi:hypothetical protein